MIARNERSKADNSILSQTFYHTVQQISDIAIRTQHKTSDVNL